MSSSSAKMKSAQKASTSKSPYNEEVKLKGKRRTREKDPERFFKWQAGSAGAGARRNISSSEHHLRKIRVAQASKERPELVRKIRNDIQILLQGPQHTSYRENCRRSMAALIIRTVILKNLERRQSRSFYQWLTFNTGAPTVKEFIKARTAVDELMERIRELRGSVEVLKREKKTLQKKLGESERWESLHASRLKKVEASIKDKEEHLKLIYIKKFYYSKLRIALYTWVERDKEIRKIEAMKKRAVSSWMNRTINKSFLTWKQQVLASKELRVRDERLKRLRCRLVRKCSSSYFQAWKMCAKTSRRRKYIISRMDGKRERTILRTSFEAFNRHMQEVRREKVKLRNAIKFWNNGVLLKVWNTWKTNVQTAQKHRLILRRSLVRMERRHLFTSLNTWRSRVLENKKNRTALKKAWIWWQKRTLSSSFLGWYTKAKYRKETRKLLLKVLSRLNNSNLYISFHTWSSNFLLQKDRERYLSKILLRKANICTSMAFISLKEEVREYKIYLANIKKAMGFMQNSTLARSFSTWKSEAHRRKKERQILRRHAAKMFHQKQYSCFQKWIAYIKRREKVRRLLSTRILNADLKQLNRALTTWRSAIESEKIIELLKRQHEEEENDRILHEKKSNVIRRLKYLLENKCFTSWKNYVIKEKMVRQRARGAIYRMNMRLQAAVINTWCDFVNRRNFLRDFMYDMAKRKEDWAIKCALKFLSDNVHVVNKREACERRAKTFMLRIAKGKMVSSFYSWLDFKNEKIRVRIIVQRSLARILKRELFCRLTAWKDFKDRRNFARCFFRKMIFCFENKEVASALRTWKLFTNSLRFEEEETKRKERSARKLMLRLQNRCIAKAFTSWELAVETLRRNRTILMRSHARLTTRTKTAAFNSWIEFSQERKYSRVLIKRLANIVEKHIRRKSLETWTKFMHDHLENQRRQEYSRKILFRIKNRMLVSAFDAWMHEVSEKKRLKTTLSRALAKMTRRKLSLANEAWLDYVSQRVFLRRIFTTLANRWSKRELFSSLVLWRQNTKRIIDAENEEKRKQALVTKMLMRVKNRQLFQCFAAWNSSIEEMKRRRILLHRATLKLKRRNVYKAFEGWIEYMEGRRNMRIKLEKFVLIVEMFLKSHALRPWRVAIQNAIEIERQEQARKVKIARAIGRMQNKKLMLTFECWLEAVEKSKIEKTKLKRAIARLKCKQMSSSFTSWADFVYERKLLRKVLNKISRKVLNIGFVSWRDFSLYKSVCGKQDEEYAALMEERRTQNIQNILQRMKNRSKLTAFNSWIEYVDRIRREKYLLKRATAKIKNKSLINCFDAWGQYLDDQLQLKHLLRKILITRETNYKDFAFGNWYQALQAYKIEAQRVKQREETMRKMILRCKNRTISQVLVSWVEFVDTRKHHRLTIQRFSARMKRQEVFKCINKWIEYTEGRLNARTVLEKIERKLQNHEMSRAWVTWKEYYLFLKYDNSAELEKFKAENEKMKKLAEEEKIRQDQAMEKERGLKVNRALQKMRNRMLSNTYLSWVDYYSEQKRIRILLTRSASKIKNRTLHASFDAWEEMKETRQFLRKIMRTAIMKVERKELACGWQSWLMYVENEKSLELMRKLENEAKENERKIREQRMNAIIQRIRLRDISSAYVAWVEQVLYIKRNRAILNRFKQKALNREASAALNTWIDYCEERKTARGLINRFIKRFELKEISKGWRSWISHNTEVERHLAASRAKELADKIQDLDAKQKEKTKRMILNRINNRCLCKAFSCWESYTVKRTNDKVLLKKMIQRMKQKEVLKCFTAWAENVCEAKRKRWLIQKSLAKLQKQAVSKVFVTWSSYAKLRSQRTDLMKNAILLIAKRMKALSWKKLLIHMNEARKESIFDPKREWEHVTARFINEYKSQLSSVSSPTNAWIKGNNTSSRMKLQVENARLHQEIEELKRKLKAYEKKSPGSRRPTWENNRAKLQPGERKTSANFEQTHSPKKLKRNNGVDADKNSEYEYKSDEFSSNDDDDDDGHDQPQVKLYGIPIEDLFDTDDDLETIQL